jgi:pimeloyl-ACP methyl ester carboxylesterase
MYFVLLFVIVLLVVLIGGVSWYISKRLLQRTSGSTPFSIAVIESNTQTITLQRTKNTRKPGIFGIRGSDGQAILGPILSSDAKTITRQLIHRKGTIAPQTKVAWNTTIYGGMLRDRLNMPIKEVSFPGRLGEMPAWFVPGKRDCWVILIHGSTATREQGLRTFQTLADLGFPILDITYRNDKGAPASADKLSHFGDTEWEDLDASVTYALAQGAQRVILYGWSMGGTIVETFLHRSASTNSVQAIILDSPVLSWRATLTSLVKRNKLPGFIARITEQIIAMRTGVRLKTLDSVDQERMDIPTLLFHGLSDTTAPISVSDTFVASHPSIKYHRIPDADHTQCWNAHHEKYEAELRSFLGDGIPLQ